MRTTSTLPAREQESWSSGARPRLADFIIAGVAKAGTTALHRYLGESADIFVPERKECRFLSRLEPQFEGGDCDTDFNRSIPPSLDDYSALFRQAGGSRLTADISPDYFHYDQNFVQSLRELYEDTPSVFVILRNPIDRAYSHHMFMSQFGWETLPFEDALDAEDARTRWTFAWHYVDASLYAARVARLEEALGDRLEVLIYEDFADVREIAEHIMTRLGLTPPAWQVERSVNVSFVPRYPALHAAVFGDKPWKRHLRRVIPEAGWLRLRRAWRSATADRPDLEPRTAERLIERFAPDVEALGRILDRDLADWLRRPRMLEASSRMR